MYKFSRSTGGFYHTDIHDSIPEDAVEVSDAEHKMLIEGQSAGRRIIAVSTGRPALSDAPVKSMVSREFATNRLSRLATGLMTKAAQAQYFSSIDEACAYTDGEFAATSEKFRALRVAMRKALIANVEILDDEIDVSTLQVMNDNLTLVIEEFNRG